MRAPMPEPWSTKSPGIEVLTARELSQYLSIAPVTVFKLAQRGTIPSFRVGICWRFWLAAIARWLKERGG